METVRRPYLDAFIEWSRNRPEVIVLSADLTSSCEIARWRDTYPGRFFSMGMAEQNMMGFASGLAREGFAPFVHTFAVFLYRRPYDQLAMSIAYPNLRVRLMGFLPGLTTPGGVTHQAIEDVALMRATPNMTILETGDATEVETVLDVAHAVDGPVYVRVLRGDVPRLFSRSEPMALDRARVLSAGTDVAILTAGISTGEAMRGASALRNKGVSIGHLHISTHKPLGDPAVAEAIERARLGVVTMENHSTVGGLGSAVAELMAEKGSGKRLIRLGLKDTYAHGASLGHLLKEYGLDALSLVRAVEALAGEATGITEDDLAQVRRPAGRGEVKAEDL